MFEDIHKNFKGVMHGLCNECHGFCERYEISVFLPGEVDFISKKLKIDSKVFVDKFCNVVKYKGHKIHLLKLGKCPFSKKKECVLEKHNCKLVRCMLYPVLIGLSNRKIRVFVDDESCPMAHRLDGAFKKQAFGIYNSIKKEIPMWWFEFVSRYDECLYDYSKLNKLKDKNIVSLDELRSCMI